MGNNIRYSKEALRDLDDIWDHIAQELWEDGRIINITVEQKYQILQAYL